MTYLLIYLIVFYVTYVSYGLYYHHREADFHTGHDGDDIPTLFLALIWPIVLIIIVMYLLFDAIPKFIYNKLK